MIKKSRQPFGGWPKVSQGINPGFFYLLQLLVQSHPSLELQFFMRVERLKNRLMAMPAIAIRSNMAASAAGIRILPMVFFH